MAKDNWHSLGDLRELERKAKRAELPELGRLALQLVANMDYLNGCVARGRGEDIDPAHPGLNVFEYIKELESATTALRERTEAAERERDELRRELEGNPIHTLLSRTLNERDEARNERGEAMANMLSSQVEANAAFAKGLRAGTEHMMERALREVAELSEAGKLTYANLSQAIRALPIKEGR
jgi:hypothetical protein